jgi:fibronectin-binding autotransporter adhesin
LNHSDNRTISNAISGFGNLVKNGSNTLTLSGSSSYTGSTTVNGGVLQVTTVANAGVNSNIGQGAGATSDLTLNNGATFRFIGSGSQSTNRAFTISTAGGTIDSSPSVGAVALTMNGTGTMAFSDVGPRTLTMAGTELTPLLIGTNVMNINITDQDGTSGRRRW